ncbi:Hypothetical_protein [Hexamita inflata]|uniref:Hypothetical_protein n=1 Tax=Hexamita inflata TaxID=28002 RepID=A0AA86QMS4_9EUKA|nr:Hypothetical protein HINF_LOCUS49070 [Hexamita inflata]
MSDAYNAYMHAKTYMTSITQINNNHIYGSLYTTLAPLEQCPAAMQRGRAGCEGCCQYPRCCEKPLVRLGITVSISGFHPGDPGPIPGVGVFLFRCCGVSARIPPLPTRHFSFCYFSTSLRSLPNSVSIDRNWSDACMLAKSTWLASSLPNTRKYDWDGIRTHAQQVKSPSKRPPQTTRPPSHQSPGLLEGVVHYLLNLLISLCQIAIQLERPITILFSAQIILTWEIFNLQQQNFIMVRYYCFITSRWSLLFNDCLNILLAFTQTIDILRQQLSVFINVQQSHSKLHNQLNLQQTMCSERVCSHVLQKSALFSNKKRRLPRLTSYLLTSTMAMLKIKQLQFLQAANCLLFKRLHKHRLCTGFPGLSNPFTIQSNRVFRPTTPIIKVYGQIWEVESYLGSVEAVSLLMIQSSS